MSKTDTPNEVAVVIVSYNTRDLLLSCLDSVSRSVRGHAIELVIVDNASTDESPRAVTETHPHARLIRNSKNVGFAAACNQAIEATAAPLILLLNSDATLTPEAFHALCGCMRSRNDCGAAGCRLVDAEGGEIVSTRFFLNPFNQAIEQTGIAPLWNIRWLNRTYCPNIDGSQMDCGVDWVEGSCLMLRREAVMQTGLFDERFFMYSEEEDLCRRLKEDGWNICYCAGGEAIHIGGASSEVNGDEMLRQFYLSQILFLQKHSGRLAGRLYSVLMRCLLTFKHLYFEAGQNRLRSEEFGRRLAALKKADQISSSR
ncbi:MAG TPA: glycosyltransferase family 2 protein [Blastocatellia bacterium]|nr:glycosyltransferase family 2 protein [Blastocatellia bacterium]